MKIETIMPLLFVAAIIVTLGIAGWTGRIYYGRGFNLRLLYVERSKHPRIFWLLVAFYVAVGGMVFPFALR